MSGVRDGNRTPAQPSSRQASTPHRGLTILLAHQAECCPGSVWTAFGLDSTIRILKLPLPRVELQPFPPDWPRSARPLPPRLLHPALQRYFLPDDTNPDNYH